MTGVTDWSRVQAVGIALPSKSASGTFALSVGTAAVILVAVIVLLVAAFGASRQDFAIAGTVILAKGSLSVVWILVAIGVIFLAAFFLHVSRAEGKGRDVLLSLRLFRNKVANLGLGTQLAQWLTLQGSFFVISVYLQEVDGYNAIKTGLLLTPATIGILAASAAAAPSRRTTV